MKILPFLMNHGGTQTMRLFPSHYLRILLLFLIALGHPLGDHVFGGTWTELPNTKIQDVGPPDPPPPGRLGSVIGAWSGAAMDTINNRLFIWGGGHNDYAGNEIYILNLTAKTMERFWGPSPVSDDFWMGACPDPTDSKLSDGTPMSRHTYGGLAYLEHVNLFWAFGGSRACGSGGFGKDTWTFDPSTKQWKNEFPTGSVPLNGVMITAYDPVTKKVFFQRARGLYTYEYGDSKTSRVNTWTKLHDEAIAGYSQMSGTIDPVRRKFVLVGGASSPGTYLMDLDGPDYKPKRLNTTNGAVIEGTQAPGLAYDPGTDRILAWDGSRKAVNPSAVWSLNVDTGNWTLIQTEGSSMSVTGSTGTFGRWRYVPALNQFVAVSAIGQNAWLYSNSGTSVQDTLPPTVTVTEPTQNATVSENVTIQASASDNTGVLGVTFQVNGVDVGPEDMTSPYSVIWDISTIQEGDYTLTAIARDGGGNSKTSTAVTVTVSSPPPSPPPPGTGYLNIPINTWIARPLSSDRTKAPSGGKHLRLAHNPDDGLIYKQGGDHAGTPGHSFQSSRNEMYTYDILTDTWTLIQPYCRTDGGPQPAGSDEHGWSWDSSRKVFWLNPGFGQDLSEGKCTQSTLIDPLTPMSYSPTTGRWTHENRRTLKDFGLGNNGSHKFSQYDPVNDELIVLTDDRVLLYTIATDTWRRVSFGGFSPTLRLQQDYSAMDPVGRVIYGVDRANPRLARYHIDNKTMDILATPPQGVYNRTQVYWDPNNQVLLWFDHNQPQLGIENPGRLHVYHPDTDTWEVDKQVDHSLVPPGVTVRGNSGVFDPYQNVLMVMGGLEPSNNYIFLYRYAEGSGQPPDVTPPDAPTNLIVN